MSLQVVLLPLFFLGAILYELAFGWQSEVGDQAGDTSIDCTVKVVMIRLRSVIMFR